MSETNKTLYGTGWSFPPTFTANGPVMVFDDEEDIRQSLQILFATQPGERIMRYGYGCDLASAAFEPISDDLLAELTTRINESILRYEQRVVVDSLLIARHPHEPSQLSIRLIYRIRGTSESQHMSGQLDLGDGRVRTLA
ncbi:GPW/gp25 family protein [Pseudomonas koreensis]|uniref:GPW/gp25 family protein n=1 Tax=Pseudomonas koreensis TaxID=198620 RepID=UPI003F847230